MSNIAGYFRGFPACSCLLQWLPAYEAELLRRGLIRESLDVYQLIGKAAASAGSHDTGGAFDDGQFSTEQLLVARNMGAAKWHRRRSQGFDIDHGHGVLVGCPHAAPLARQQITSLNNYRNGLANNGPDDGPRQGVQWPLRTWQQGIAWAKPREEPFMTDAQYEDIRSRIGGEEGGISLAKRVALLADDVDALADKIAVDGIDYDLLADKVADRLAKRLAS